MLKLEKAVLEQLQNSFSGSTIEQGFLLGCRKNLEWVDVCRPVPVRQADTYFITPDVGQTNQQIKDWLDENVCFCGMIHSHVNQKYDLSEGDTSFAKQLYDAYQLPVLWFGIGVVRAQGVELIFYQVHLKNGQVSIDRVPWQVRENALPE